jgi:uncharacterized protein (TIGR02597 family)
MFAPNYTTAVAVAAFLAGAYLAGATTVYTDPVGAVVINLPANTDTNVSLTLLRPAVVQSAIQSADPAAKSLSFGANLFTVNELVYAVDVQPNTYYVQVTSGPMEGQFATVLSNTANTIMTDFEEVVLDMVAAGDTVAIRPYWTLGTLFPAADAGVSFIASTNNLLSGRRSELLVPDTASVGLNKSSAATYFFNGYWRQVGNVGANQNDLPLLPDTYITHRSRSATATQLVIAGAVMTHYHAIPMVRTAFTANDVAVGLPVPIDIKLSELNLVGEGRPFQVSTNNLQSGRGDELLIYLNTPTGGYNKASAATYFFNGYWRRVGAVGDNQNDYPIPAGSALKVRLKANPEPSIVDWHARVPASFD